MNNPYEIIELKEIFDTKSDGEDTTRERFTLGYKVGERKDTLHIGKNDKLKSSVRDMIIMSDSVHQDEKDNFHFTMSTRYVNTEHINKQMNREPTCDDHNTIEVSYIASTIDCCGTEEDIENHYIPTQHIAGYLVGKKNGVLKIAHIKTVYNDKTIYENVHIIPEGSIKKMSCIT